MRPGFRIFVFVVLASLTLGGCVCETQSKKIGAPRIGDGPFVSGQPLTIGLTGMGFDVPESGACPDVVVVRVGREYFDQRAESDEHVRDDRRLCLLRYPASVTVRPRTQLASERQTLSVQLVSDNRAAYVDWAATWELPIDVVAAAPPQIPVGTAPGTPSPPAVPGPAALRAAFTVGAPGARTGRPATLDASSSTGSPRSYAWDLDGNGTYEHEQATPVLTWTFTQANETVSVGLRVTDAAGTTAATTQPVEVLEPAAPAVSFTITALGGNAYRFDGSGTTDPDGDALTDFAWSFGHGGQTASGAVVEHTFPDGAPYTVGLQVTDASGMADQAFAVNTSAGTPRAAAAAAGKARRAAGCRRRSRCARRRSSTRWGRSGGAPGPSPRRSSSPARRTGRSRGSCAAAPRPASRSSRPRAGPGGWRARRAGSSRRWTAPAARVTSWSWPASAAPPRSACASPGR